MGYLVQIFLDIDLQVREGVYILVLAICVGFCSIYGVIWIKVYGLPAH